MFAAFFPNPRLFFPALILWTAISVTVWYSVGSDIGGFFGFEIVAAHSQVVGIDYFWTPSFLWFDVYFLFVVVSFAALWMRVFPHKWQLWSIFGSSFILYSTYFSVQIAVAINNWRRPFFDAVQNAFSGNKVHASELYELIFVFLQISFMSVAVYVITKFVVSHYVFRWRTAMNDYYMSKWKQVRIIEGASQRVQEDTMRFATIMETLGVNMVDSVMTLFAFLPVLYVLSASVTELPIVGAIPAPLFVAAIIWSIFGTGLLALVGIKLPGLEFKNQRVEAAYRKELVYGEDSEDRAQPITVKELFANVRKNYFRLYFHYMYFNITRSLYLQADNIFTYFIMIPTIVAGKITYGILQQILTAFGQVSSSFQYLVNSWPTIVELLSIYKRLKTFEAAIHDQPLPDIDLDYLAETFVEE